MVQIQVIKCFWSDESDEPSCVVGRYVDSQNILQSTSSDSDIRGKMVCFFKPIMRIFGAFNPGCSDGAPTK